MIEKIGIRTGRHTEFIDITSLVREAVSRSGIQSGICHVYTPHTTAAVTINEHADPDVISDMTLTLEKLVPWQNDYAHTEGNSAAHIKAGLLGSSQAVFVEEGQPALGTWQGIFFAEFDGPRHREVWIKIFEQRS